MLLGEALKGVRVEEGAGTAVVQYLRELRGKTNTQQTEFGWSDDEWQKFLTCPPVVPLGYNTRKERVSRTMRSCRMCRVATCACWNRPFANLAVGTDGLSQHGA
jgi:hypothetical protein